MRIKETLIALCTGTLFATLGYLWFASAGLQGSPDISVMTIKGKELQLAGYRGNPLLVTFWATTCPGCIKEIPHLIELYEELQPQGLEIIGIAMAYDPPNQVVAMSKARNIPYPIALDIHSDAAQAFGDVRLTPTSFLIAPDGRIVYQKIGKLDMAKLRQNILGLLAYDTAPALALPLQRERECFPECWVTSVLPGTYRQAASLDTPHGSQGYAQRCSG